MSASHAMSALTAVAALGLILATRRAATHPSRKSHGAGSARPPWRRTAHAPDMIPPPASDESARAAVKDAEEHVRHCWLQLQAHPERPE